MQEGDWVAPHGKGKVGDFLFSLTRRFASPRDYESSLRLDFSHPGDGVFPFEVPSSSSGSELRLPRIAAPEGYKPRWILGNRRLPGKFFESDEREERNYFVRVRTVLDQQGKVVSALYGKIDGDIRFSPIRSKTCSLMFTYYLNPTPNDRNMEFDPKRNLFGELPVDQRVTAP